MMYIDLTKNEIELSASESLKIKEELKKLRIELSMLLAEKDSLLLVECKNIEMEYMFKIGHLEYEEYELRCTALKLKRKIELIQMYKNRQEEIDIDAIEDILYDEFLEYQQKMQEAMKKINESLSRSQCDTLSENEAEEIKKLYRKIVKALHPDLNPDSTPEKIKLFNNAVTAYENGDLNALRVIY